MAASTRLATRSRTSSGFSVWGNASTPTLSRALSQAEAAFGNPITPSVEPAHSMAIRSLRLTAAIILNISYCSPPPALGRQRQAGVLLNG